MGMKSNAETRKANVHGNAEFGKLFYDFKAYQENLNEDNVLDVAKETIEELSEMDFVFGGLKSYKVVFKYENDEGDYYQITMTDKVNILK